MRYFYVNATIRRFGIKIFFPPWMGEGGGDEGNSEMKLKNVSFQSEGQRISGIFHLPEKKNPPCVIASHGLLSSKNSEKYIALGEQLSKEGMAMLRFDFRGVGESEGRIEDDTVSRRIVDLGSAIDFVKSRYDLGNRMGLLGSSLGGYVSLIKASMEKEIRAIVIWATPFHLDDLKSNKGAEGHPLPAEAFLKDLPKHRLLPLLSKISNCMVIHGEEDELVPVDQAWEIFHSLGAPKEIHILEGADHRLTDPKHRQRAMELTVEWFKKYL
jgi:dipeptidyl aminopeptidase/acylaminoacyl peptidase